MNFVVRQGEVSRVDGPYAEAKEIVGGWSLLQYDSLEEAVAAGEQAFTEVEGQQVVVGAEQDEGDGGAVADLAEELEITDPGRARHRGLQVRVHGEGDQTVDVQRRQPGIIESVEHRFGGQPQLTTPGVLGEVGGTDTGDGRLTRQAHCVPPNATVDVAMT